MFSELKETKMNDEMDFGRGQGRCGGSGRSHGHKHAGGHAAVAAAVDGHQSHPAGWLEKNQTF